MSDKLQFVMVARKKPFASTIDRLKFAGHSCNDANENQSENRGGNPPQHRGSTAGDWFTARAAGWRALSRPCLRTRRARDSRDLWRSRRPGQRASPDGNERRGSRAGGPDPGTLQHGTFAVARKTARGIATGSDRAIARPQCEEDSGAAPGAGDHRHG